MKRLFSGMQPTGDLHLGNYIGALKNWVGLQDEYDCIFCIVDMHAITIPYDTKQMRTSIFNAAADYLAAGLNPQKCTIFVQSQVSQHTELAWMFNTVTPLGQLMRMTQFKQKTQQFAEGGQNDDDKPIEERAGFLALAGKVNAGLLTYPVLQAADILLYKGEVVPVGEDQIQHVELTRDVARRFNNLYGDIFPMSDALLSSSPRLRGLDGVNKMSKSIGNHIALSLDREELIKKVTREAASDPRRVRRDDAGVPEECNVYDWHRIFSNDEDIRWAAEGCRTAGIGCFQCKKKLAETMDDLIAPIREKRAELEKHPDDVWDILRMGAARCNKIANETMEEVKNAMGLWLE